MQVKKTLSIVIFLSLVVSLGYVLYKTWYYSPVSVNVVTLNQGFDSLSVPEDSLKTPLFQEISSGNSMIESSTSLSACAVEVKHSDIEYENGYYVWTLQARKSSNLIPFKATQEDVQKCEQGLANCPCVETSQIGSDTICYVNSSNTESRVHLSPYYLNLSDNHLCDFGFDKSNLSLQDKSGNIVTSIVIPEGELASEFYEVKIPTTSQSLENGCVRASVNIVKVNDQVSSDCSSTGEEFSVFATSSDSSSSSRKASASEFYSASFIKQSDHLYRLACFISEDNYSNTANYGFSILGQDNGLIEDIDCSQNCTIEKVFDTNSQKVYMSYYLDHLFKQSGSYKLICSKNN